MSARLPDLVPTRRQPPPLAESRMKVAPEADARRRQSGPPSSPLLAIGGIVIGSIPQFVFNLPLIAQALWTVALIGAGFPVVWRTLRAARQGNYATDVIASLSIITAVI